MALFPFQFGLISFILSFLNSTLHYLCTDILQPHFFAIFNFGPFWPLFPETIGTNILYFIITKFYSSPLPLYRYITTSLFFQFSSLVHFGPFFMKSFILSLLNSTLHYLCTDILHPHNGRMGEKHYTPCYFIVWGIINQSLNAYL